MLGNLLLRVLKFKNQTQCQINYFFKNFLATLFLDHFSNTRVFLKRQQPGTAAFQ